MFLFSININLHNQMPQEVERPQTINGRKRFLENNLLSSTDTNFPIDMGKYFSNLKTNFPNNQYGSCGYVALSQVLTYYDTVINDYIVPFAFDVESSGSSIGEIVSNSPGSIFENLDVSSEVAYTSVVQNSKTYNLQSALMESFKNSFGYYRFSVGPWEYQSVLNSFLPTMLRSYFSVNTYEPVIGETKNKLLIE